MKKIILLLTGICLMALCCNNKKPEQYTDSPFAGSWISKSYIDSLYKGGTPALAGNVSCEELIVNFSGDSALLLNLGIDTTVFKIDNKKEKSFSIKKFNEDDYTEFTLSENKKELNYGYKKYNQKLAFRKTESKYAVKSVNGWSSALELYVNENVIAANYFIINVDNKPGTPVSFTSYGIVEGLPGYSKFSLCIGGECMDKAHRDLITLSNEKSSDEFFWEWKSDTLVFNSVNIVGKKGEVGHIEKSAEIFKFLKKL